MYKEFINITKQEQIEYLEKKKIETKIDGDIFEVSGNIDDVDILENEYEYFIAVNFSKNSLFNENVLIFYDSKYEPIGKLAYSCNYKDGKVSFDYFFVRKDLRSQGLGQTMIDLFMDKMDEKLGEDFEVFVNPYSFDVSFNGSKGYDFESQYYQYRLEHFYINNGFLLTEDPKKYAFGGAEYDEELYKLTEFPLEDDYI